MKAAKLKPTKQAEAREEVLVFRATKDELAAIMVNAKRFTGGNLSEWLRFSALKCVPPKEDFKK